MPQNISKSPHVLAFATTTFANNADVGISLSHENVGYLLALMLHMTLCI